MKLFGAIRDWMRRCDRDNARARLKDPELIAYDQKLRLARVTQGCHAAIAYMHVSGETREWIHTFKGLSWVEAQLPVPGTWEVIVRRTDV